MNVTDVKLIKKIVQFKGYFGVVFYQLKYRLFNGGWGEEIKREVLKEDMRPGPFSMTLIWIKLFL